MFILETMKWSEMIFEPFRFFRDHFEILFQNYVKIWRILIDTKIFVEFLTVR